MEKTRCKWAEQNILEQEYHDKEWGRPLHNDQKLFELLILEGMQAGLSWDTILKKRENFREAFDHFDVDKVAQYGEEKTAELLENAGIVRNRLKVAAAAKNAKAFQKIQQEFGSFDRYIWRFVDGNPILNLWSCQEEVPAFTPLSDQISKDLKRRGFQFVGTTIIYAYMQSAGLVNDHTMDCFCFKDARNKF